ncbi:MAG TPA: hypothetical protein VJV74_16055 [Terriglobia bacterium]|nr:hypothetical protein [Terriglobia bacterium]
MADPELAAVAEKEGRVLRALCQGTFEGSVRASARSLLAGYPWREPLHQVIFEAILAIPSDTPEVIQNELPARLTRRGFPDFQLNDIFASQNLSKDEVEGLMRELAGGAREESGEI